MVFIYCLFSLPSQNIRNLTYFISTFRHLSPQTYSHSIHEFINVFNRQVWNYDFVYFQMGVLSYVINDMFPKYT